MQLRRTPGGWAWLGTSVGGLLVLLSVLEGPLVAWLVWNREVVVEQPVALLLLRTTWLTAALAACGLWGVLRAPAMMERAAWFHLAVRADGEGLRFSRRPFDDWTVPWADLYRIVVRPHARTLGSRVVGHTWRLVLHRKGKPTLDLIAGDYDDVDGLLEMLPGVVAITVEDERDQGRAERE